MLSNPLIRLSAALSLTALGLVGCDNAQGNAARANAAICISYGKTPPATPGVAQEGAAAVENCVQRWAYSLAPSRDDAAAVAEAVVAACATPLTAWNRQILNQPGSESEAASITTGQSTTPIAEHYAFTQNRALLYVVQARAGHCAPPPAKNGVPEGVG